MMAYSVPIHEDYILWTQEMEKVFANKEVYTTIACGAWKKENQLRSFKEHSILFVRFIEPQF